MPDARDAPSGPATVCLLPLKLSRRSTVAMFFIYPHLQYPTPKSQH